ncbi:MAG: cupredoxin family protein [Betaproteobacteria bacterium]|nr:cupredoxin family protein [Betaproteobacteria bacterium]MBA3775901.1 cupredoxin family protein [Betaproteobacteria bacterium]
MDIKSTLTLLGFGLATVVAGPVLAHGDSHGKPAVKVKKAVKAEQKPFGIAGNPTKVSRTVNMDASDEMRFSPAVLNVKLGETIRFRLKNTGKTMHEMVIGTLPDLKEHAELMKKFPDMEHEEPYMAHVKPGATEEIVWQFNRAGEFNYACLIPGHFEAGMIGKAIVK